MNSKIIHGLFIVCVLSTLPTSAKGITITFEDGVTSPSRPGGEAVGGYYSDQGVLMPNLRFHLSTYSGNVPFNFVDDWGAVVDFGVFGSSTGIIQFTTSVDSVQIEGMAQGAFDLNGAEPFSWSIKAIDSANNQIAFASESFGFDFAGVPNPPDTDPYPLARLSLSLESAGPISRLEIDSDRKLGLDTIRFESTAGPVTPVADDSNTAMLLVLGILGIGGVSIVTHLRPAGVISSGRPNQGHV